MPKKNLRKINISTKQNYSKPLNLQTSSQWHPLTIWTPRCSYKVRGPKCDNVCTVMNMTVNICFWYCQYRNQTTKYGIVYKQFKYCSFFIRSSTEISETPRVAIHLPARTMCRKLHELHYLGKNICRLCIKVLFWSGLFQKYMRITPWILRMCCTVGRIEFRAENVSLA